MKTFDELKQDRIKFETEKINSETKSLEYDNPSEYKRTELKNNIKKRKRVLENIDEVVKSEIAYYINILYENLNIYQIHPNFDKLFYNDFIMFITKITNLSLTKDNKFKANSYYGYNLDVQDAILYFDFTLDELNFLVKEKFNQDTRDKFIIYINNQYGTDIPLLSKLEYAKKRLFECWFHEKLKFTKDKEHKILKAKNGEFMKKDRNRHIYPQYYQSSIIEYYDKIIEKIQELNNDVKTRKKER